MDDFGSTFFDLSSSPSYSLCSGSATNNIGSNTFTYNDSTTISNNLLQEQVEDLDSMFLPSNSTEIPGNEKNSLSALLDNLADDPVSSTNVEPLNIDSLIDQDKPLLASNTDNVQQPHQISKNGNTSSSEKLLKPTNMVQVKLVKPINVINSSNGMIPVTVHSLSGQKHSIIRTSLPMCGPRVHLLPVINHSGIPKTNPKQENAENAIKV